MSSTDLSAGVGAGVQTMARAAAHSTPVRSAFTGFPAAVSALCAIVDGAPVGLIATSLMVGVSYDPPMVGFSARNGSATWPILLEADRIGVSVLSEHQGDLCRQIASTTGDRFAGVVTTQLPSGALLLNGATTWMECSVAGTSAAGDHTLVTLLVRHVGHSDTTPPLVFHAGSFPRLHHN